MPQPKFIEVEVRGITEVMREIAGKSKSLQTTFGIMMRNAAILVKKEAKNRAPHDTGTLSESIDMKKIQPYEWRVGDYNYPVGIIPYGAHQEMGFRRHTIHRSQINPMTNNPALVDFLQSNRQFITLGPFHGTWFMTRSLNAMYPVIRQMIDNKVWEALKT